MYKVLDKDTIKSKNYAAFVCGKTWVCLKK